jgi:hypothetical protein
MARPKRDVIWVDTEADRRQKKIDSGQRVGGQRGAARIYGECGGRRKNGNHCKLVAGYGTSHYGTGKCRYHGGNLPSHKKKAIKDEAILMGAPKDINPVDALYWCIRITAGEVEWLRGQMAQLDTSEWYEDTLLGKQFNILVRTHDAAVERLAKFSKEAISLGLAERAVRLAENYGQSLAALMRGILGDLDLNEKQMRKVPVTIRKHLELMENTQMSPDIPAIIEGNSTKVETAA